MHAPSPRAEALAAAFLAARSWNRSALARAAAEAFALPVQTSWIREAAKRALSLFAAPPHAHFRELAVALDTLRDADGGFVIARAPIRSFPVPTIAMGKTRWSVPPLETTGDLARWLHLTPAETMWLADPRGLERRTCGPEALRHYRYAWVAKASGGVRLLEIPKPRIKAIEQRILHDLLDGVPPHEAAHGFRRNHSTRTHAAIHVGASIVLRIDLSDFFLSVSAARVRAVFAALGYPSEVAWLLTCLTTNIAPVPKRIVPAGTSAASIRKIRHAEMLARTRHLPQGAPTSPALANLVAYGLDIRLAAAATSAGARYSRYADDLVFSGDAAFAHRAVRFKSLVECIAREEGFVVNRSKTRLMRKGSRQMVTGVVVNERPTIGRAETKQLEAILYSCARHGPGTQNREGVADFQAHLRGRVAHVASIDPNRAKRLEALLERIAWP